MRMRHHEFYYLSFNSNQNQVFMQGRPLLGFGTAQTQVTTVTIWQVRDNNSLSAAINFTFLHCKDA